MLKASRTNPKSKKCRALHLALKRSSNALFVARGTSRGKPSSPTKIETRKALVVTFRRRLEDHRANLRKNAYKGEKSLRMRTTKGSSKRELTRGLRSN